MSLSLTLNNALSGLTVSQSALGTISQNVANANTVGYSRQVVETQPRIIGGQGNGVEIAGIKRVVDGFLIKELQSQRATLGKAAAIESFTEELQARFGTPGSNSTISAELTDFASALDTLATVPEDPALRFDVVAAADTLARSIANLADSTQRLRASADAEISAAVDAVNQALIKVEQLNVQIARDRAFGNNTTALEDERDKAVATITDNIDVTVLERESGAFSLITTGGQTLLDASLRQLSYSGASTVNGDTVFGPITIFNADPETLTLSGNGETLVSGGQSPDVTDNLASGRIKGLLQVRDSELDNLARQVDVLADTVRDAYNQVHNTGSSFPPPNALTGTREVATTDTFQGTGVVRIAVVNPSGQIVGTPLDLDLDALGATTVGTLATTISTALSPDASAAVVNGALVITAADAANGIAINENTSQVTGTTQAFSDFFGLNDLFVGDEATDMAVRADIISDPGRVATALLGTTAASGETALAIGDNRVVLELAQLSEQRFSFAAVGGLPAGDFTFGDYAATITGMTAVRAAQAGETADLNRVLFDNLETRASAISGVNVDEEMANMIVFQNAFSASARVLSTAVEMFDLLIDIAR